MRFLAKVTIPREEGDAAFEKLAATIQAAMARLRPEAAYFFEEEGVRQCLFVFDLDIRSLLKPLFPNLDASFDVTQVMNVVEFQGLAGGERRQHSAEMTRDLVTDLRPQGSGMPGPEAVDSLGGAAPPAGNPDAH